MTHAEGMPKMNWQQQLETLTRAILAGSVVLGLLLSRVAHGEPDTRVAFEPYLGSYALAADLVLIISLDEGSLYAQTTGQPKHRLVPVSEHRFSYSSSKRELHFTIGSDGRASSVTLHLDGGTQVAERSDGSRPAAPPVPVASAALADAVLARDQAEVRKLVAQGADIHGLDTRPGTGGANGRLPLNFAALDNDTEMIELLLELGADINRQNLSGFTPLHHAVEAQAVEAIALLLKRGADTTVKNNRGLTPAEFALASRRTRAAAALGVSPRAE